MSRLDDLRVLFNSFLNRRQTNRRQMKRVFQWRRYLDWKDLTYEEKLSAKRFLLIPVFAYLIIWIFNQNIFLVILLLIGYVVYKKFEKGKIVKK
tara:strand:- start:33 stop:314 length:282 start_codon:yes stop_codon:yes gene_type:complete